MALSPEELGLFKERIRFLDKKIQPGLSKLLWSTKGASSFFINDCRLHASKVSSGEDSPERFTLLCRVLCNLCLGVYTYTLKHMH